MGHRVQTPKTSFARCLPSCRNVLAFYSSTFFQGIGKKSDERASKDAMDALWLSWGIGLANFIFTAPAYYLIDKRGRRFLLLVTYPGMAASMLAASLSFMISVDSSARIAVIAFFMFVFIFFYSWGQGPVPFAYSSEVFPLLNREAGMSFAVFVNLFGAGILTMFVPQLTSALAYGDSDGAYAAGQSRLLGLFAGLNVLAFLLIFFLMPETAGATLSKEEGSLNYISLEELNYIFGVPTLKHISYQLVHVVPWAFAMFKWYVRRCFRRRRKVADRDDYGGDDGDGRPASLEPLYTWVDVREIEKRRRKRAKETGENLVEPVEEPESYAEHELRA